MFRERHVQDKFRSFIKLFQYFFYGVPNGPDLKPGCQTDLIQRIHDRLNLNYKRSILHSPFEKIHHYNFYDPFERAISEFKTKRPQKETKNISKTEYKVNDLVYVKKFNASKTEKTILRTLHGNKCRRKEKMDQSGWH